MRRVVPTALPRDPLVGNVDDFGRAIRAARTCSGVTLTDAATALGISKQTLSDLETAPASVGLGIALRVARELGVAVFVVRSADRHVVRRAIEHAGQPSASPAAALFDADASKPAPPVRAPATPIKARETHR